MTPEGISGTQPQGGDLRHGVMLGVALAFLTLVGLVLPHGDSGEGFREWLLGHAWFLPVMLGLWAVIALEGVVGAFSAADEWPVRMRRLGLTLVVPPLRMVTASSTPRGWLWLPGAGWKRTGEATSEKLDQRLALPMVVLTLLVLPVLGAELTGGENLENHPRMALATHFMTCVIWVGFTAEFLWMVAAAPDKVTYCLKHWINLVIILLPLVAFLRVLNLFRFGRMIRAGKLLRAYRLRGLWTRLWRLAMLFNLFERLQQRDPAKYRVVLEKKIAELEKELASLHVKLEATCERLEAAQESKSPSPSSQPSASTSA